MGYVKIAKANGEFDLLPAEDIGTIEFPGANSLSFNYVTGRKITLTFAGTISQTNGIDSDDQKITRAIEKMNGASAPSIFPEALSQFLLSSSNLAITT
tara:strand:- start:885 stop:1178 length:294 start_codon:yes stop_codon:yes gene_type:complete